MNTRLQNSVLSQVTGCSELMDFSADDGGNAGAFVWLYGHEYLYVPELGWLHWNGKYWEQDMAALVKAVEDTLVQRRMEAVRCNQEKIVGTSKRDAFRILGAITLLESRLHADIDDFDSSPDILNVANGVVDLTSGDIYPHESSQHFTYVVPVEYDLKADSTVWETFLQEAVTPIGEKPDAALLDFIQQAMGYSFTGLIMHSERIDRWTPKHSWYPLTGQTRTLTSFICG